MTDPLEILDAIDRERGESFIGMIQANQVQRLRDEIVALRRIVNGLVASGARAAALEEAAQACVGSGAIVAEARLCASAIRALKDSP